MNLRQRFAKMQNHVCIVKLLSKFRVECSKNTPEIIHAHPKRIIIQPTNGIHLSIISRKR
ncbi:Cytochrome P450 6B46 [Operophtera brumata]|uniref:Cytochrome P450 6B46 n=1 Tax=Operophtera brumata TaxID=104452 RepID=A0A0L7LI22_OPEBR|nr:Cytochrome P450 6B46 [Operophtera brumata]